jgi:hypothetical protein
VIDTEFGQVGLPGVEVGAVGDGEPDVVQAGTVFVEPVGGRGRSRVRAGSAAHRADPILPARGDVGAVQWPPFVDPALARHAPRGGRQHFQPFATDRVATVDAPSVTPTAEPVECQFEFDQSVSGRVPEHVGDLQPGGRSLADTCAVRELGQLIEAEVALLP